MGPYERERKYCKAEKANVGIMISEITLAESGTVVFLAMKIREEQSVFYLQHILSDSDKYT